ncbi:MAG TPA: transglycosylase SLT domain-containing protein [Fibrobacteria bacterium]|nr:transglycosylase SLT domain-containing protein [Fibrobacteria bacterium]HOX50516.1 transglycosylase SLT domain-containing protein [Fibrobacteria bacterium]
MRRIWTLSFTPTLVGALALAVLFLGDTILSIAFGAKITWTRREQARVSTRLDSLDRTSDSLRRVDRLRSVLVRACSGRIDPGDATILAREIDWNARLYDFDPLLILAVVLTESGGQFEALGRHSGGNLSGAVGVMQIQPITARAMAGELGLDPPVSEDLLDPSFNVRIGVAFLLKMVHRYGDLRMGILAYNMGPVALENRLKGNEALPQRYVQVVMANYRRLRSLPP